MSPLLLLVHGHKTNPIGWRNLKKTFPWQCPHTSSGRAVRSFLEQYRKIFRKNGFKHHPHYLSFVLAQILDRKEASGILLRVVIQIQNKKFNLDHLKSTQRLIQREM
jgi:hypothetical protein